MTTFRSYRLAGPGWGDRRGTVLVAVMLMALAISALVVAGISIAGSTDVVQKSGERNSILENAADAGLAEARSTLNAEPGYFVPPSGSLYRMLETNAPVLDAAGTPIAGLTRSLYVGPTGNTSGAYGIYGNILSAVTDQYGNRAIRRGEVYVDPFTKYAMFEEHEGGVSFGGGDVIDGPFHSNDDVNILASGVEFKSSMTVSGRVRGANYGVFREGYDERVPQIHLPDPQAIEELRGSAQLRTHPVRGQHRSLRDAFPR